MALLDLLAVGADAALIFLVATGSSELADALGRATRMNATFQIHGFEHQRLWINCDP